MSTGLIRLMPLLFFMISCGYHPDTFEYHTHGIITAQYSAMGTYLVTATASGNAYLWNYKEKEVRYVWQHRKNSIIQHIAISQDESRVMTATDTHWYLWNAHTGQPIGQWVAPDNIRDISISPDGTQIALALSNQQALWFNHNNQHITLFQAHDHMVNQIQIIDDGNTVISADDGGMLIAWKSNTGKPIWTLNQQNSVIYLNYTPNSKTLISYDLNQRLIVYDLHKKQKKTIIQLKEREYRVTNTTKLNNHLLIAQPNQKITLWQIQPVIQKQIYHIADKVWSKQNGMILALHYDIKRNRLYAISSNGLGHYFDQIIAGDEPH